MAQRKLEDLSRSRCLDLLKSHEVGRIVFVDDGGPAAVPVNYGLAGDEIVFRVAADSNLRRILGNGPVAFEVDHTDPETRNGWSVLVRGNAREVALEDVPKLLDLMRETLPRPWAEGIHNHWIAIAMVDVTGRRLDAAFHTAAF